MKNLNASYDEDLEFVLNDMVRVYVRIPNHLQNEIIVSNDPDFWEKEERLKKLVDDVDNEDIKIDSFDFM